MNTRTENWNGNGIRFVEKSPVAELEALTTPLVAWINVAIIESHSISSRLGCPVCYSAEAGYLAGDKVITAACRDCGCIYKFREKEVNKG